LSKSARGQAEVASAFFTWCFSHFPEISSAKWTLSFENAQFYAKTLQSYADTKYEVLILFITSCFIFLQTWCLPGTVFMNLLAGALLEKSWLICAVCNTIGATNIIILSKICLTSLFKEGSFLGNQLQKVKEKTKIDKMLNEDKFSLI